MSRRKSGTLIVALAALVWLSLPFAAGQDGQPKAVYPAMVHDFGTVERGATLEHTFIVRNEGTAPLEILSVKPT